MAIQWRDSMSVSNNIIDQDHKHLIDLINQMEQVLDNPDDKKPILDTLAYLKLYTVEHFNREEILQLKIRYPETNKHKQIHHTIVKELDETIVSLKNQSGPANADEITGLLHSWLINHVLQEDLPLKPYFAKFPSSLS